jgi:hypothetical protein
MQNDLKSTTSAKLTYKWNVLDTNTESQGAQVSITGPACSADYTGDIHMQVWKDNAYGTFMLWPTP